jgi:hypothetical protein
MSTFSQRCVAGKRTPVMRADLVCGLALLVSKAPAFGDRRSCRFALIG